MSKRQDYQQAIGQWEQMVEGVQPDGTDLDSALKRMEKAAFSAVQLLAEARYDFKSAGDNSDKAKLRFTLKQKKHHDLVLALNDVQQIRGRRCSGGNTADLPKVLAEAKEAVKDVFEQLHKLSH